MSKRGFEVYFKKIAQGTALFLIILGALFSMNKDVLVGQLCLYGVLPGYKIEDSVKILFKFNQKNEESIDVSTNQEVAAVFNIDKIEETNITDNVNDVMGLEDIIYEHESSKTSDGIIENASSTQFTPENMYVLRDLKLLEKSFYTVDESTEITAEHFNVDNFISGNLKITNSNEPKILIFHTHSHEKYLDSVDITEGVIGVGEELRKVLEEKYGIISIHNTKSYDIVHGRSQIMGAYERMEPDITKILEENPSIEIVIDMHRDGVPQSTKLVAGVNGEPTAKIMFFNGISQTYKNGELVVLDSLPNENLDKNLAFSFNMQLAANQLFPGLARKIYINSYRYSLHMKAKSLLVEVGAQTNTKEEAYNAAEPLADILAKVVLE